MPERQSATPAKAAAKQPKVAAPAAAPLRRRPAAATPDAPEPKKSARPSRPGVAKPVANTPQEAPAGAAEPSAGSGGPGRSRRSTGYRQRSYYIPDELHLRARNTWWWTQNRPGGLQTLSELVETSMAGLVAAMEEIHNKGKPFPPAPDTVRSGPSPGGAARQKEAMKAYWLEQITGVSKAARKP